jgi:hypothetical protein
VPEAIKQACIPLTPKYALASPNPIKFKSMGITGYSVSFSDEDDLMKEVNSLLTPYKRNEITII